MRALAGVLVLIGLVYSDLSSGHWWFNYLLPLLTTACLLYLFWFKAFVALAGAVIVWQLMDIDGASLLRSLLMPLLLGLFLVLFLLWSGVTQTLSDIGGDAGDCGGDGGDGGC